MDVFDNIGRNYDFYPSTSIALCAIAYDDMLAIRGEISSQTGLQIVWGPAELRSWDDISYSRAYIAGDAATGEYFVVIRGTNFDSIVSWSEQDFDLAKTKPFGALPGNPPGVPVDALIAQGSFNGMIDLLTLRDPATGASMLEFLKMLQPQFLYVTGHSLGGTLTPTLFAYLNAMLYGAGPVTNMALWSFAGLTAGGTRFNAYFNSILPNDQGFLWRIQNSLDVAPLCWWSYPRIQQVYVPYDLHWDCIDKDAVEDLFADAAKAGIGYAHPQPGVVLPGAFDHSILDGDIWALQALHQHHPATYQALVKTRYPNGGR